ncbi:MAG: OmpP1/FadL family transporter [Myxococcota bacterium]
MTRRVVATSLLACLAFLAAAPEARAGAYALHEFSAISTGRGHATAARLDSPETMFMNPAGLATLDGLQVSLNGSMVFGNTEWSHPDGDEEPATMNPLVAIPSAAVSYRYADWGAAGVGFAAPNGLTLNWPDGWAGEALANEVSLKVPTVYGVAAFQPLEGLFVAAAFHYARPSADLKQTLGRDSEGNPTAEIDVHGTGHGYGAGFGVMYRPGLGLHFGLSYKSRMKLDLSGSGSAPAAEDTSGSTTVWTPDEVNLAAGWAPNDQWYVEADVSLQVWTMLDEIALQIGPGFRVALPQDYDLSWLYKVGVEYQPTDVIGARLGLGFETSPIPDETLSPILPDSERLLVSGGLTVNIPQTPVSVDLAYFLVQFLDRTAREAPLPSHYEIRANWVALSLRYSGTNL